MSIIGKIKWFAEKPSRFIIGIQVKYARIFHNQKALVRALFWSSMNKHLNLKNPKTFNEKLNWLKVYDHNPLYHTLVDKFAVKEYVASIIGQEYLIPTLGVWDSFDEIDFSSLPERFVLKSTNGGGNTGVVICKDKEHFDFISAKIKLEKSMAFDIYKNMGEWAYKGVKPRIIAEKYMEEVAPDKALDSELSDYKFYCFDGKATFCQVIRNRSTDESIDFFDMNWNHMPFVGLNPIAKNGKTPVARPSNLNDMIKVAEALSKDIPFTRIDLYQINSITYFGKVTFYPNSGVGTLNPEEWNTRLGDLIKLPMINGGGYKVLVNDGEVHICKGLDDYKIWCFNGEPKVLFFATDRNNESGLPPKFDYYDINLNHLNIRSRGHQNSQFRLSHFPNFETMLDLSRKLSKKIPFIRVDFYEINNKVYFGELTFYHDSGFVSFEPNDWDIELGKQISLPTKKNTRYEDRRL